MELEALPAAKGDCFLLHYGTAEEPGLIVIDGGPAGTYATLKARLIVLRQERIGAGILGADDDLVIELLVVSHVDDDHINGVQALLQDLAGDELHRPRFKIRRMWHNAFGTILDAQNGYVVPTAFGSAASDDEVDARSFTQVLASVKQGYDVLELAKKLHIPVNPEWSGKAIVAPSERIDVAGLKITVLGPLQQELDKLRDAFARWLEDQAKKKAPAPIPAVFNDVSVPNLSSIVLLVEGEGKRFLLTGDARGDKIMKAATLLGLVDDNDQLPLDVLKVPHHGSDRNNAPNFFAFAPAKRYIFSGNGEHGNPERETLSYLLEARPDTDLTISLTYPPTTIDAARELNWQTRNPALPSWNGEEQGIVRFLADHTRVKLYHSKALCRHSGRSAGTRGYRRICAVKVSDRAPLEGDASPWHPAEVKKSRCIKAWRAFVA